ncbi:MAG: M50 family metallopeptidase [Patescibacteria group bacterium]
MFFSILIFFIVLSILVIVHEFGHYWVAKRNGIWVEEFGFGLPPRVFGKKIGETIYSINLLPFGGFVRLHGEQDESMVTNPNRAFLNKSKKVRIAVVIAGVLMNFILAVFAFSIVYSFSGIPRDMGRVKVVDVSAGSPAQVAGIIVGDIIKKVDGREVFEVDDFIKFVGEKKGKKVVVETETKKLTLIPRETPPSGEGPLGVVITTTEIYFPPIYLRPFYGAYYGFKEALFWGKTVILGFGSLFTNLLQGEVPKDVAGPVGIFAVTSQVAKIGILALVNFVGILSVNLAILNILPFPALDGGRLLFIFIEKIIGRKVVPKVEAAIHSIGMIILLILILAITTHDIRRLISAGGISGFIENIVK